MLECDECIVISEKITKLLFELSCAYCSVILWLAVGGWLLTSSLIAVGSWRLEVGFNVRMVAERRVFGETCSLR